MLSVQFGDRGLPRQRDGERDAAPLPFGQAETTGDGEALEGDETLGLTALVLGLDPGDQFQSDVVDVEVGLAALEVDLTAEATAGEEGAGVEDRVHRGPAHSERAEQPFEHHGGVLLRVCV